VQNIKRTVQNKRDIAQCAKCQRYGHTNNYCHLKSRCVKTAGDHLTNQCHWTERSSDAWCVLCDRDKDVRFTRSYKKHPTPQFENIHSSRTKQTTLLGMTNAEITRKNSYSPINIEQEPHINQSHQQTSDAQELKKISWVFLNKWELW
jgi:hypothetical protein